MYHTYTNTFECIYVNVQTCINGIVHVLRAGKVESVIVLIAWVNE